MARRLALTVTFVVPALALVLAACSTAPWNPAPVSVPGAPAVTRQLDADAPVTIAGGATFSAPKSWFVTARDGLVVLEDPDRTLTVTFVERDDSSGTSAIAESWKLVHPGFARRIRRTTRPVPGDWDDHVRIEYQATTAEARTVIANARRWRGTWYVTLIDGPRAAVDRRAAQVNTAFSSFRAPGLVSESWRGRTPHALDEARVRTFEAFVDAIRVRAKVPGAAIAVVQKGRVVYEKGFGVRELGQSDPVTPDTLFMVGSITKPLTSLMMAVLVDQGRFTWDTPVTELLPSFALGDADATRRLTMRHTVCACTGLPRQDMEFFFGYLRATPESRLADMRGMVPTTRFGETFQYSNGLVSAGGYVAARARHPELALGPAYDRAIRELVLDPLGMTRTTFDFAAAERGDHARPHGVMRPGEHVALPTSWERWLPPIRPAGGAWSSARDMARYVQLELGGGATPDGRAVVSRANLMKRREPQVKVNAWSSYALALGVDTYKGIPLVGHGGSTSGFSALMFFLPEHDLGGIVLTNGWGAFAFTAAVRARLLEILFDGRDEAERRFDVAMKERAEAQALARARLETEPAPASLRPFVGAYRHATLGPVRVRLDGQRAFFETTDWRIALGRRADRDGTTKLVLLDPPWTFFELIADVADGRPRLILERPQHRYVFERSDAD